MLLTNAKKAIINALPTFKELTLNTCNNQLLWSQVNSSQLTQWAFAYRDCDHPS